MSPPLHPNASITLACVALSCGTGETGRSPETQPDESGPSAPSAIPNGTETVVTDPTTATPTSSATAPGTIIIEVPEEPPPLLEQCRSDGVEGSSQARALMEPFVVRHQRVARRTLYSWTTREQIEELRQDPTLLTRSATSEGERGRAADVIVEHAESDPLAALLARPEYENKRFAWSNPWATLLGWSGESYGDHLLGITLRREALIGRLLLDASNVLQWDFFDTEGTPVDSAEVLDNPERLAAIYFVDSRDPSLCQGSINHAGSVLREYFVCNESMVERWETFTPALAEELERGISALTALRASLESAACEAPIEEPACWRERVVASWAADPTDAASPSTDELQPLNYVVPLYEASLALPNDLYMPSLRNLDYLLERLGQLPVEGEALSHDYPANSINNPADDNTEETDGGSPR